MKSRRSIESQVRVLTNRERDRLTEQEIYRSRQMQQYLNDLSKSLCAGTAKSANISITEDKLFCPTAFTNGSAVVLNWQSDICRFFATAEDRFIAFMGLFFHEHAHILYKNFEEDSYAVDSVTQGKLYGDAPVPNSDEEEETLKELLTAVENPAYAPIFGLVYHKLDNTVSDYHDEWKISYDYGKTVTESLKRSEEALRASCIPLEERERDIKDGKISRLGSMFGMILEYVRFERILCNDPKVEKNSEYIKVLETLAPYANRAKYADDSYAKFSALNSVVLALWPYIREELNKQQNSNQQSSGQQNTAQNQNGQSQGSSNPQTPTEEQVREIINQLSQGAQQIPQSAPAQNRQSSKTAKANAKKEREAGQTTAPQGRSNPPQSASGEEPNALSGDFEQIAGQLAQAKAESELEAEQGKEISHDAEATLGATSSHNDVPVTVNRCVEVSATDRRIYDTVMSDVRLYSKALQKKMLEIMKDMKLGDVSRHKAYGKLIIAKDAYRADELMFANKKQPQDMPDMAISVLVDHSGSMSGTRIESSMKAAILLHDFAAGIGIPVAVCGHRANGDGVEYLVYTDFDAYSKNDCFRLAQMRADNCNRDGAAIEISASRLAARPEKLKLLIVISDGCPNHTFGGGYYGGEMAKEDMKDIIRKYRRKGIEILGAAIGEDKPQISEIYGDGFLDISDLQLMPKQLVKLVQKRILNDI